MNWKNVNLSSPSESSQDILDSYNFDDLLLEISCNLNEITPETVRKQALYEINLKYKTAIQILEDNLQNITDAALKYRAIP